MQHWIRELATWDAGTESSDLGEMEKKKRFNSENL